MSVTNGRRKDSDIQAAAGPPDPELESLIAPQGYDPNLVDEVATMETPQEQRRKAIRFMIWMLLLAGLGFWFCTPANLIVPENLDDPAPFSLDTRPPVPTDKFLEDVVPKNIGDFTLVDLRTKQAFEDPYIGALIVQATYINEAGQPVTVVMTEAESYINARRYLENYKQLIEERASIEEWRERLYIDKNYIQWAAPDFADRAYGLAWNNRGHFIAVTSPVQAAQTALAAEFPY